MVPWLATFILIAALIAIVWIFQSHLNTNRVNRELQRQNYMPNEVFPKTEAGIPQLTNDIVNNAMQQHNGAEWQHKMLLLEQFVLNVLLDAQNNTFDLHKIAGFRVIHTLRPMSAYAFCVRTQEGQDVLIVACLGYLFKKDNIDFLRSASVPIAKNNAGKDIRFSDKSFKLAQDAGITKKTIAIINNMQPTTPIIIVGYSHGSRLADAILLDLLHAKIQNPVTVLTYGGVASGNKELVDLISEQYPRYYRTFNTLDMAPMIGIMSGLFFEEQYVPTGISRPITAPMMHYKTNHALAAYIWHNKKRLHQINSGDTSDKFVAVF